MISLLLALCLIVPQLLGSSVSCAEEIDLTSVDGAKKYFADKTIGVVSGTIFDRYLEQSIPTAKLEYYNSQADLTLAIIDGKIDGLMADEPIARMMCAINPALYKLPFVFEEDHYGMILNKKDTALRDQLSKTIRRLKADGALEKLEAKWFTADESSWTAPDMDALTGENGTLDVAVDTSLQPFALVKDRTIIGYDVDILYEMAKEHGYKLNITSMEFAACLSSVIAGKADIASASISITEERKEKVLYAEAHYSGGFVMVVPAKVRPSTAKTEQQSPLDTREGLFAYLKGRNIGVLSGSNQDAIAQEHFPESTLLYFPDASVLALALREGKIDAFMEDLPVAQMLCARNDTFRFSKAALNSEQYGYIFNKDRSELKKQLDDVILRMKADGTLDALSKKWLSADESLWVIEDAALTGENGTLSVASTMSNTPFETYQNGLPVGYAIEILIQFAKEYGYRLEYDVMDFTAIIPSIASRKSDIGSNTITITEERKEQVLFSEPIYDGGVVVMLTDAAFGSGGAEAAAETQEAGFFASIASSFERTFIRESRWRLILQGLWMTVLISVCSALLGTVLGGLVCMMRRSSHAPISCFAGAFIKLLQGTPIVVLLMILYYVVFGNVDAVPVAVIGFSLNFAAYTSEMMRTGLNAVDKGQLEAAMALGYNKRQAYTGVIIPQAARYVLPVYRGELISLVKNTSVVGYIAIQDLTKMSDIIRSRTYEAFFPLIATAVIYFLLAWGLISLLTLIEKKTDPRRRRREVRDVKTKQASQMEA